MTIAVLLVGGVCGLLDSRRLGADGMGVPAGKGCFTK
jgi:hypothetical protein